MTAKWNVEGVPCFFEDRRVYLGDVSWDAAHSWMVDTFLEWASDDCPCCAEWAQEQLPALVALPAGSEWEGDVEGDEYFIVKAGSGDAQ